MQLQRAHAPGCNTAAVALMSSIQELGPLSADHLNGFGHANYSSSTTPTAARRFARMRSGSLQANSALHMTVHARKLGSSYAPGSARRRDSTAHFVPLLLPARALPSRQAHIGST